MRIKILTTPPVDPDCGIVEGQVYQTVGAEEEGRSGGVWILAKGGEPVKLEHHEYQILSQNSDMVPRGFYVTRGPNEIAAGMELGRGKRFSFNRLKALHNLAEGERAKLRRTWLESEDRRKWTWTTKCRVSMSPDIASELTGDRNSSKRELQKCTLSAFEYPGEKVERWPVSVKDVCRSYVEILIETDKSNE